MGCTCLERPAEREFSTRAETGTFLCMRSPVDAAAVMFLKQLFKTPRGRAYFLAQLVATEGADENRIFEALEKFADPQLQRMTRRHAADEQRHAALLRERQAALGTAAPALPPELDVLAHI